MSNSKKIQTFNIKKTKKAQAKKRKLEAFLDLVRKDDLASKKKAPSNFQENYQALKNELRKYQKTKSVDPSFFLKDDGRCAFVNLSLDGKISNSCSPLFVEDIHHFLLTSVLGNVAPYPPRWAKLENAQSISKTVFFEIEALSQQDVIEMYSKLDSSIFPFVIEIISSEIPFATELSALHLTPGLCKQGTSYSSIFSVDQTSLNITAKPDSEYKFSKLHLLLSPIQLAMEHYPLPQSVFEQSKSDGYCFSKETYTTVNDKSPMFAVDCEMCRTVSGRQDVTRVAIVNEKLETIYHSLVKPKERIVDYITKFSGITEKMLRNITTTLEDVQKDMREILPSDAILCGQSLNCDLHALKMIHPYVIDTSIIFNEHGVRHKKTSLKKLAQIHLKEVIQNGKKGHSPIEDSIAAMRLVQLKLKNSLEYGDAVLSSDTTEKDGTVSPNVETCRIQNLIKLNPDSKGKSFFSRISRFSKKACLIGSENSLNNYYEELITDDVTKVFKSKIKKIMKTTSDNIENYDLILSHLSLHAEDCSVEELTDEIKQMYATLPTKTTFIIFISGVNKQPNEKFKHNFCMINLKK